MQRCKAFFVAGKILEVSNIHAASDIADLDLDTNLSLGGPAQSTLRDARTIGQPIPGINAFCAPVFDAAGHLVLGITAMGPEASFDNEWNGKVAGPLRACALEVSRRLGYLEAA